MGVYGKGSGQHLLHLPQVLVISLSFLRYIQEYWLKNKGQYPSLGFVAIVYALHTCDQVRHLLQLTDLHSSAIKISVFQLGAADGSWPVILATQEAEFRRTAARSQLRQIV
jgi:hypothetical protein